MHSNKVRRWLSLLVPLAMLAAVVLGVALGLGRAVADTPSPFVPPYAGETFTAVITLPEQPQLDSFPAPDLSAGWQGIYTQTFESTPSNWMLMEGPNDNTSGEFLWGISDYGFGPSLPGSKSAWAVGGGINGSNLDPVSDGYPSGVDSWMVLGPYNLSGVSAATLSFDYWIQANINDTFGVALSLDGTNFSGVQTNSGGAGSWATVTYTLTNAYVGQPAVYIAYRFTSVTNGDASSLRGAFVDNVVLRGNAPTEFFMPVIINDPTATPPPTATPIATGPFIDNFSDIATNWTVIRNGNDARGEFRYLCCSHAEFIVRELQSFSLASPLRPAIAKPYEVESEIDLYKSFVQNDERYGLVFGGDSAFNAFHMLQVRWVDRGAGQGALEYRLAKVDSYNSNGTPKITSLTGDWAEVPSSAVPVATDPVEWRVEVKTNGDVAIFANKVRLETVNGVNVSQPYFGLAVWSSTTAGVRSTRIDIMEYRVVPD